jgi:transposase
MRKTLNKYFPDARERAVCMASDNTGRHESRCAAIVSVFEKIGCIAQTLNEWVGRSLWWQAVRLRVSNFTCVASW